MDEMLGLGWLCTLHPEDAPKFERDFKNAFEKQIPIREQYRFLRADGEYRWMLAVGAPRLTPAGKFVGYFGTYTDFHELKEAQDALKKSEERLQLALNATRDGVWDWDFKNDKAWWDHRYSEIISVDIPEEERSFSTVSKYIHADDRQKLADALEQHITNGKEYNLEFRFIRPSGEVRYIHIKGKAVRGESGEFERLTGTITDITDRKKAEEEKYKLASIIEASSDYVGLATIDGKGIYVNPAGLGIVGWESVEGKTILDNIYPEDRALAEKVLLPRLLSDGSFSHEIRFWNERTGEPVWVLWNGISIKDPHTGEVIALATISPDITERKKTELYYKLFLAMCENSSDFIGIATPEGQPFYMNPAGRKMLGIENDEIKDVKVIDHFLEEDRSFVENVILPAQEREGKWIGEFRFRNFKTGEVIPVLYNQFLVKDPDTGELLGMATVSPDITAQKKVEEELKRAQHDTKMLMQKKDEFMAVASHELKTPITTVKASLQLIERLTADNTNQIIKTYLGKATSQVNKLSGLVSDLLDISKIHAGKIQYSVQEFTLAEVIEDCITFSKAEAKHDIIVNGDVTFTMRADRNRLEQALCNLLSNAVKYSPGADKVLVDVVRQGDMVKVAVTDFGIGIEKEKIPYVFDRFFRVSESSMKFPGLGLGLYITSEIIKRHGGEIDVWSEFGKGSTFYFTVPVDASARLAEAEARENSKK